MATVELHDLVKTYGPHTAVDRVSLTVANGEFVALVGPSGCGKTTTLNLVAGLLELTAGTIRIGAREVGRLDPKDRDVAMVFQNYALYPNKTVRQNLLFPLQMRKMPRPEAERRMQEAARALALEPLLARYPRELSGGQQQRVALGRAMVREPAVFLMDEPLSNLDATLRVQMRAELKRFHQDQRATVLYVTHDQLEAMTMADRIAVMNGGRLQQYDSPATVFARPANLFVASFVGSPAMNLLRAELSSGTLRGEGGWTLPLPDPLRRRAERATTPSLVLGIRHSALAVHTDPVPVSIPGRIYTTEPTGDLTYAHIDIGGVTPGLASVVASVPPAASLAPDQPVWLTPDPARLHLFDAATQQNLEPPA